MAVATSLTPRGFSYLLLLAPLMTWYDTLTSTPVLIAGAVGISAALFARAQSTSGTAHQVAQQAKEATRDAIHADNPRAKMAQAVSSPFLTLVRLIE